MNKKVILLIVFVLLSTMLNFYQYNKIKKSKIKHQKEMDSLTSYSEKLEEQLEILTDFIVDEEIERAKDF